MKKIIVPIALAIASSALWIAPTAAQAASGCSTPDVSANQNSAALKCKGPISGKTQFRIGIQCNTGFVYGPWRKIAGSNTLYSSAGCSGNGTISSIAAYVK